MRCTAYRKWGLGQTCAAPVSHSINRRRRTLTAERSRARATARIERSPTCIRRDVSLSKQRQHNSCWRRNRHRHRHRHRCQGCAPPSHMDKGCGEERRARQPACNCNAARAKIHHQVWCTRRTTCILSSAGPGGRRDQCGGRGWEEGGWGMRRANFINAVKFGGSVTEFEFELGHSRANGFLYTSAKGGG